MVARLSALRAGHPLIPGRFLVLISIRGWVNPQGNISAGKIRSDEKSSDIRNWTHNFLACGMCRDNAQATVPHWAPPEYKSRALSLSLDQPTDNLVTIILHRWQHQVRSEIRNISAGKIRSDEKSSDIRNWTHNFLACSIVPQPCYHWASITSFKKKFVGKSTDFFFWQFPNLYNSCLICLQELQMTYDYDKHFLISSKTSFWLLCVIYIS
jgi:hypothetical protein